MMQGLALSHRFWEEVARPKIETDLLTCCPTLRRAFAAKVRMHFLMTMFQDHDLGPGVMLSF